jgi:peptide/nickel transport system substrate-binding protein
MGIKVLQASVICIFAGWQLGAQAGGQLRFCLHADPATFDPLLAAEEASETVRYLTAGVLLRFNRQTQQLEPELATSWKVMDGGKRIDFVLRRNVRFSDGTPLTADDVIATMRRLGRPDLQSAIADTIRTAAGNIAAAANGPDGVSVSFSTPVAGLERLFDSLAICSRQHAPDARVGLGPFMLDSYRGGQYVLLRRNPNYWKTGADGARLPYLDSVRLDIQSNRELELFRFRTGELHLIDKVEPEAFERLRKEKPAAALNVGASLDTELFWFNLSPAASLPAYKKGWFGSKVFRQAIAAAINRNDIVRLVYRGYAHAAAGAVSAANRFWFNANVRSYKYDPQLALKQLQEEGFRFSGHALRDARGNVVEISLITNAGNQTRVQIGRMIQQDLAKIGVQVNFLPVEFQSLIERITRTQQYETCLLGLTNVETDPNDQMNVWMSSGSHHPWNPGQEKPATAWESEIDRLMQEQHSVLSSETRRRAFNRVQEIIAEEEPIIPLVHPDVLAAISADLRGYAASVLPPHLFWNIENLSLTSVQGGRD